jgi:transcriptional activator SPT7
MTGKVLEHAGFQGALCFWDCRWFETNVPLGTAKSALDVLAGVTSEYLLNVGRTVTFLSDKFANQMTSEVRFCSGATVGLMFTINAGNHSSYLV